jgi:hypothetical protein
MKLPAFVFLFLASVAVSSAWAGTEAPRAQERSTYSSSTENAIDLRSDQGTGADAGQAIQIVVPEVGSFPGWLQGNVLEVTLVRTAGNTRYELAPEPDYLQFVQPDASMASHR